MHGGPVSGAITRGLRSVVARSPWRVEARSPVGRLWNTTVCHRQDCSGYSNCLVLGFKLHSHQTLCGIDDSAFIAPVNTDFMVVCIQAALVISSMVASDPCVLGVLNILQWTFCPRGSSYDRGPSILNTAVNASNANFPNTGNIVLSRCSSFKFGKTSNSILINRVNYPS